MERRSFVAATAIAGLSGIACRQSPGALRTLSESEARTLAALCGQIIPNDDCPGAVEAGAVRFIDIQLTRRYRVYRQRYRDGILAAESIAAKRFNRPLADLPPDQRQLCAEQLEHEAPDFFSLLVAHTMQSFYGSPRHGGNRDGMSWKMLGVAPVQVRGRDLSLPPQPGKARS